jgi:phage terminase small subunit
MAATALGEVLNDQQRLFCREYLVDLNVTKAYIRAGYGASGAASNAYRLMEKDEIKDFISELEAHRVSSADVSAATILRELNRLATFKTADMFDAHGNLKAPKDWTPEMSASVASFEVVARNLSAGDGSTDTIHKVRLYDKTRALELLAKHLSLLIDRVEHTGTIQIQWLDGPQPADVHVLPSAPVAEQIEVVVPRQIEGVGVGGGGEDEKGE